MDKVINCVKKVPLLLAVLAIAVALIFLRVFRTFDILPAAALRIFLAAVMAGFLYLISGEKTFKKCFRQTGYVVETLLPVLIYVTIIGLAQFYINYSSDGLCFGEGWQMELAKCAALMMSVGLFEEFLCRAVVCDALIYQFRKFRGVFILTGILVGFVFGAMHIVGSPIRTPLMMAQAALKVTSAGLLGFTLLMMYWKTRDIIGCAVVHALYDFLAAVPSALYGGFSLQQVGEYVLEGNEGWAVVAVLLVDMLIELGIIIAVWRKVMRTIDFEEMRREW